MADLRTFQFKNNARSTLATAISAAQTSLEIQANHGERFPAILAGDIFPVILTALGKYEICYCTARSGDVLTLERGKEGTTAQSFSVGADVVHNVTAGFFEQRVALAQPPSTPVLTGTLLDNDYHLEWTESLSTVVGVSVTGYELYKQVDAGGYSLLASIDADDPLTYDDDDLPYGHTYQYYVIGIASSGANSAHSNVVTARPSVLLALSNDASGNVMRSVDGGETWTNFTTLPLIANFRGLAFSPTLDRVVAFSSQTANANSFAYSDDYGATWTVAPKSDDDTQAINSLAYARWLDLFVAGSTTDSGTMWVYTSLDGVTWTKRATSGWGTSGAIAPLFEVPELELLYAGGGNKPAYSTDGIAWHDLGSNVGQLRPESQSYGRQNYSPTLNFAAMGGTPNGHFWIQPITSAATDTGVSSGAGSSSNPIAWSPQLAAFLAVYPSSFKRSVDGETWEDVTPAVNVGTPFDAGSVPAVSLCWSKTYERFVSVGKTNAGAAAYSPSGDAESWATQYSPADADWVYLLAIEGE